MSLSRGENVWRRVNLANFHLRCFNLLCNIHTDKESSDGRSASPDTQVPLNYAQPLQNIYLNNRNKLHWSLATNLEAIGREDNKS